MYTEAGYLKMCLMDCDESLSISGIQGLHLETDSDPDTNLNENIQAYLDHQQAQFSPDPDIDLDFVQSFYWFTLSSACEKNFIKAFVTLQREMKSI